MIRRNKVEKRSPDLGRLKYTDSVKPRSTNSKETALYQTQCKVNSKVKIKFKKDESLVRFLSE